MNEAECREFQEFQQLIPRSMQQYTALLITDFDDSTYADAFTQFGPSFSRRPVFKFNSEVTLLAKQADHFQETLRQRHWKQNEAQLGKLFHEIEEFLSRTDLEDLADHRQFLPPQILSNDTPDASPIKQENFKLNNPREVLSRRASNLERPAPPPKPILQIKSMVPSMPAVQQTSISFVLTEDRPPPPLPRRPSMRPKSFMVAKAKEEKPQPPTDNFKRFSPEAVPPDPSNLTNSFSESYDAEEELGKGGFAVVKADRNANPPIAKKYIWKNFRSKPDAVLNREREALERMRHPNVIVYYDFFEERDFYVITMELCEKGNLRQVIDDPKTIYSMKTVYYWAEHLFAGLAYFEKIALLHRDIKPSNILVTFNYTLKFADFGLVKDLNSQVESSHRNVGTYRYMALETYELQGPPQPSYKSDLYAVGLILWEIVERKVVFQKYGGPSNFKFFQFAMDLRDGKATLDDPKCEKNLKSIINRCTNSERELRPSPGEVFPLIKEMRQNFTSYEFWPKEREKQKELIRPIGFNGTEDEVMVNSSEERANSSESDENETTIIAF